MRSFDVNIKSRLQTFQNEAKISSEIENDTMNSLASTINYEQDDEDDGEEEVNPVNQQQEYIKSLLDENDKVKSYINFSDLDEAIKSDPEFEQLTADLLGLDGENVIRF